MVGACMYTKLLTTLKTLWKFIFELVCQVNTQRNIFWIWNQACNGYPKTWIWSTYIYVYANTFSVKLSVAKLKSLQIFIMGILIRIWKHLLSNFATVSDKMLLVPLSNSWIYSHVGHRLTIVSHRGLIYLLFGLGRHVFLLYLTPINVSLTVILDSLLYWLGSTFFKEFHSGLAQTVKCLLNPLGPSEALFFGPKRGDSLDNFLKEIKDIGLHYGITENYDAEIWKRHQRFLSGDESWPNYETDHCYPLLVRISLWKSLFMSSWIFSQS